MTPKNVHSSAPDHSSLSPRQVAQAIGVSESSLKRWCDRGELPVTKTAGGHRRIARDDVVRFLRRRGFDPQRPDLLGLPAGARLEARDRELVLPQLIEALIAGNESKMISLLTGLFLAKRSLAEIADDFIRPAFETIGNRWQHHRLEVFEEHRAVVVARRSLYQLSTYLKSAPKEAPVAVAATLAGDPYDIPLALIDLALREIGWNTMALGPNHPVDTLKHSLERIRPRLCCISVNFVADEDSLVADASALYHKASELGVAVAMGGARIDDRLHKLLPCTAHCASMKDLVALARGLEPSVSSNSANAEESGP